MNVLTNTTLPHKPFFLLLKMGQLCQHQVFMHVVLVSQGCPTLRIFNLSSYDT